MRITRFANSTTLIASTLLALGLAVSACGSSDSGSGGPDGSGDGGESGDGSEPGGGSSSGANGGEGTGGSGAQGGDGPGPGGAGEGSGGRGGPDLEPGEDAPGFDGVDDGLDATTPPAGCVGGFDPDTNSLAIELDASVPVVVIQVVDGAVHANGTACESAAGDAAAIEAVRSVAITGGDGDETVYVDAGTAFGGDLTSASGGFTIDLGAGDDQLVVLGSDAADDVAAGSSGASVLVDFSGDAEPDVDASNVESLLISTGPEADLVRCDGARLGVDALGVPALLYGSGNNDVLLGGAADDELFGGIGNDSLAAGASTGGADVYDGGDGTDEVDFSARTAAIAVTLAGGADDGEAGEGDDVRSSVENVVGSQGPNELTGSELPNQLFGGASDDALTGGLGSDALTGGDGDDVLLGEDGDDLLYGELGDDELRGGAGDDIVDGFGGRDVIDGGTGDGDICSFTGEDTVSACEL